MTNGHLIYVKYDRTKIDKYSVNYFLEKLHLKFIFPRMMKFQIT